MTLCTQADIEHRLQWDITAEPDPVVTDLIAAAQGLIEAEAGRTLESAARVEMLDGDYPEIYLTHWPVTSIASVDEDGTTLAVDTDYIFNDDGRLVRVSDGRPKAWATRKLEAIEVTYTGGFLSPNHDSELAHLGSLCTEVVARAFRQGAASAAAPAGVGLGGITQVTLHGSDTVTYATPTGDLATVGGGLTRFLFLFPDEKEQLFKYRNPPVA